jgi:galactokinase
MNIQNQVIERFARLYGEPPALVIRAPGRVNLIGEHTDYNDGFVLPMAINRAVWIALRPRDDRRVVLHSLNFDEATTIDLDALANDDEGWVEYVKGVAYVLQSQSHALRGWEGVVAGDVPIGAGLSSSAAVEMATARAFSAMSDLPWDPPAMARVGQRAENEWVGVNCGIMDQMISAAGRRDHALLIDCRSLETTQVPIPAGTVVVILDTATRRGLVESAYNERRAQCEAVAAHFGVPALRDLASTTLASRANELDPVALRRARHVITDSERTLRAADAMTRGDAAEMGVLMNQSHASYRDDFEASRPEVDAMVLLAQSHPACFGARLTGGGFGGCAVALVRAEGAEAFAAEVSREYEAATGLHPQVYICTATDGAAIVARS